MRSRIEKTKFTEVYITEVDFTRAEVFTAYTVALSDVGTFVQLADVVREMATKAISDEHKELIGSRKGMLNNFNVREEKDKYIVSAFLNLE